MSIKESRIYITQSTIEFALNTADIFNTKDLEIETGIAVLPFVNMSNDPDNEYFSDGVSEQILDTLVQTNRMRVIARTSSFSFKGKNLDVKEIGRALGVTHILEGSVRKWKGNVRITAQLIDAGTGAHLWSDTYDRELLDIFAIQDELAEKITTEIEPLLRVVSDATQHAVASRGTKSALAFDLYLQAQHFANIDNPIEMEKSISLYEQATAADNNYADAWSGLAEIYLRLGSFPYSTRIAAEVLPITIEASTRALQIEPNHPRAMGLLGWALMVQEFKWNEGIALVEKSLALNPLDAQVQALYGMYLLSTKQVSAVTVLEKAYRLNPLDPLTITFRAMEMSQNDQALDASALLQTMLINNQQGYAANFLVSYYSLGRPKIQKIHRDRLSDLVGADHPGVRRLDISIANQSDPERGRKIQQELRQLLRQNSPVPITYQLTDGLGQTEMERFIELLLDQRALDPIVLFAPKPYGVSNEFWNNVKKIARVAEVKLGTVSYGAQRTQQEIEALKQNAVPMSDKDLNLYVGEYRDSKSPTLLKIDIYENKLRMSVPSRSDEFNDGEGLLIPAGNHLFTHLAWKGTMEFFLEDGKVVRMAREYGDYQNDWTYEKIK